MSANPNEIDVIIGYSDSGVAFRIFSRPEKKERVFDKVIFDLKEIRHLKFFDATKDGDDFKSELAWETAIIPGTEVTLTVTAQSVIILFSTHCYISPAAETPFSEVKFSITMELMGLSAAGIFEPFIRLTSLKTVFWEKRTGATVPEQPITDLSWEGKVLLSNIDQIRLATNPNLSGVSVSRMGFAPFGIAQALKIVNDKRAEVMAFDSLEFKLRFEKEESTVKKFVLTFEVELQIINPTAEIQPIGFTGNRQDFTARTAGATTIFFVRLKQQQPIKESVYHKGAGARYNFIVQFPHHPSFFDWWNNKVQQPLQQAQLLVNAGRSATFLPRLSFINNPATIKSWNFIFTILDTSRTKSLPHPKPPLQLTDIEIVGADASSTRAVKVYLNSITPSKSAPAAPVKNQLDVQASFTGLKTVNNNGDTPATHRINIRLLPVENIADKKIADIATLDFLFHFQEYQPPASAAIKARLQGLTLLLPEPSSTPTLSPLLEGVGTFLVKLKLTEKVSIHKIEANFKMAVTGFEAGKQDDESGEEFKEGKQEGGLDIEKPTAVIIPIRSSQPGDQLRYQLEVNEKVTTLVSHDVTLKLNEISSSNQQPINTDVFIIDPEPLFIARVKTIDIGQDRLAALTNEIGNWGFRPEGGFSWNVSISDKSFAILLPPQAIGEEMHRYKDADDITAGEPADMRFGLTASIKVYSNEFGQRFSQLPWNLRNRLGVADQKDPGALVEKMTVELVYGISQEITKPNLRIAEVQSRLGNLPPFLPEAPIWKSSGQQSDHYENYKTYWENLLNAIRSRIAVLEPYIPTGVPDNTSESNQQKRQPTIFTTEDGLTVTLRKDADLASPFDPRVIDDHGEVQFPKEPHGLKGSFAWAFESVNIYKALWKDTKATSAKLSGLLLTSFGGSGNITASFDHGLTTIDAVVTMGRIDRIKIERKGRISVLWNRAKHVIIYDRTVAATRQFFLEQHAYIGNVILRKTEEYVEIEERERPFKNKEAVSLETGLQINQQAGFIESCVFPGADYPRIKVSSRWGSDISGGSNAANSTWRGWKVPLWVRGAAPADVYPKPDIRLMVAAQEENESEPCVIDHPEKLYFFTLTEASQVKDPGNVESWNPIPGVDYAPIVQSIGDAMSTNDGQKDIEDAIVEGSGAYTFAITPQKPVNLVSARQKNAIATALSTITVIRGPLENAAMWTEPAALSKARKGLDKALSGMLPLKSLVEKAENSQVIFNDYKQRIAACYDQLQKTVTTAVDEFPPADVLITEIKQKLETGYTTFIKDIKEEATYVLNQRTGVIVDQLKQVLDQGNTNLEVLKNKVNELINGTATETGLKQRLSELRGAPGQVLQILNNATNELLKQAADLRTNANAQFTNIINKVRSRLFEEAFQLHATITGQAQQFIQTTDTCLLEITKRWTTTGIPTRILTFASPGNQTSFTVARKSFQLFVQGEIYALQAALQQLIDRAGSATDQDIKQVIKRVEDINTEIVKRINTVKNAWDNVKQAVEDIKLNTTLFDEQVENFRNYFQDQISKIPLTDVPSFGKALKRRIEEYVDELGKGDVLLNILKEDVGKEMANVFDKVLLKTRDEIKSYFQTSLPSIDPILMTGELADVLNGLKDLKPKELLNKLEDLFGEAAIFSDRLMKYSELISKPAIQLPALPEAVQSQLQNGIKLLRAFGETPKIPGLDFDRNVLKGVAYTFLNKKNFEEIASAVQMTKLQSFIGDPAGDFINSTTTELKKLVPASLTFPTNELRDRFEPFVDDLKKLSVSDVFKNLTGIPFKGLFPGIKMPDLADKGIHVSHEFDKKTLTARVHADINVPFEKGRPVPIFSLAGITLTLLDANLKARVDIIAELNKPPRTRAEGEIFGNWEIKIGGYAVVEIVRTALRFDESGKIKFDLSPGNIKLKQVLQFISDFLQKLSYSDSGFTIRILPTGVESALSLPVPDMQGAAFGIANLHVGFRLALDFGGGDFMISTGLFAGRKTAPFTITIFILGGAGWLETDLIYIPATGIFKTRVSIGIMASASLALSLGPVSGGIFAYFGITAEYEGETGRAGNLTVGVLLMFTGRVSLLRIIEVSLGLILQAEYRQGGGLTGRGTVFYKIKIGWFFTIKVQARVEYMFGKPKNQTSTEMVATAAASTLLARHMVDNENNALTLDEYDLLANQYLLMFED